MSAQGLCPVLNHVILFLLMSSCILDAHPLPTVWFFRSFILLVVFLFSWCCPLAHKFLLILSKPRLAIFGLFCYNVIVRMALLTSVSGSLPLRFSLQIFIAIDLLLTDTFYVDLCTWCKVRVWLHSFTRSYIAFPAVFVEKKNLSFTKWMFLVPVQNQLAKG